MPRKTKQTLADEAAAFAAAVADAIAARPFDPSHAADASECYAQLAPEMQAAVAAEIFADFRQRGLSGDDLRAKYGGARDGGKSGGLTGPMRRKVLRAHGYGSGVARSYSAYSDGDPRSGSAHARQHGPQAAERAAAAAAQAEQEQAAALASAADALRAAGKRVPRDPAKRLAAASKLAA